MTITAMNGIGINSGNAIRRNIGYDWLNNAFHSTS
jgi:hypothetical protein